MNAGVAEGGDRASLVVFEGSGRVLVMEQCGQAGRAIEELVERTSDLTAYCIRE